MKDLTPAPSSTLLGYADRWSVSPGETVHFMVSSLEARPYRVQIVRLRQPELSPEDTRFAPVPVDAACNGMKSGRFQALATGSCGVVARAPLLADISSFTLVVYVFPTRIGFKRQAIMGTWSEAEGTGFGLELDELGHPVLRVGDGCAPHGELRASRPLMERRWYRLAGSFDVDTGETRLWQTSLQPGGQLNGAAVLARRQINGGRPKSGPYLTFAAWPHSLLSNLSGMRATEFCAHFDGKLERPRLAAVAMTEMEIEVLDQEPLALTGTGGLVAAWDFSDGISTDTARDQGPHMLNATLVNQPKRGTPGVSWRGQTISWTHRPDLYGAIHFHSDDLIDAGWETDFEFAVPIGLRSGIYAAHLRDDSFESWIPFIVTPDGEASRSDVVFLVPTATYMAYLNHRSRFGSLANERLHGRLNVIDALDCRFLQTPGMGLSTYDRHADGSGVVYASRCRPAQNFRPTGRLWNFSIDLLIIEWLEACGIPYDTITDEDLHHKTINCLNQYRVVITGSHPEYMSTEMLDALEGFTQAGGRLMYMGGNGFYWRIAYHPSRDGVIEVRRSIGGVRAWEGEPGEGHLGFTGEYGGLWRHCGRPPQRLAGVGFIAQGFDQSEPYRLTPEARDPRVSWALDGVTSDIIGDRGVLNGAAAGIEIDAVDRTLGSPDHILVIARSGEHSNTYELAAEEVLVPHGATDGLLNDRIHAEMVFFETRFGGAVFATGSIAYAGALRYNDFSNNACAIALNILERFRNPERFGMPLHGKVLEHNS